MHYVVTSKLGSKSVDQEPECQKRALVTGGAGFIGSHLVDALLREGWYVTVIDNFDGFYDPAVKRRNLPSAEWRSKCMIIEASLLDPRLEAYVRGEFDVIVHLAAKAGVGPSIEDPLPYHEVNVLGTQIMLEVARRKGIRQFVFASSSSVYGINPNVPWREDDHVLMPISPYASTKISGELMGRVYSHLYGIRFIALRLFTVYGPRQRPDLAIHQFARRILAGEPVPVFGEGCCRRDYTFVGDVVRGIRRAMDYSQTPYEVINIGSHRPVTLFEVIRALESVLGLRATLDRRPSRAGDAPQTYADITKAAALLGYEPQTGFMAGLREFGTWLKNEQMLARCV